MSEKNDKKPKRILSEEHKAKLAEARKKANEVRLKNMHERKEQKNLEITVNELEKKNKINELKKRKKIAEKIEPELDNVKEFVKEEKEEIVNNEEETEIVYKKREKAPQKKKKKKIIYYDESSSEEEIEYRKIKKDKKLTEEPKEEPKQIASLSDDVIRRQFNTELEHARIQELVKFFKPQTNWRR